MVRQAWLQVVKVAGQVPSTHSQGAGKYWCSAPFLSLTGPELSDWCYLIQGIFPSQLTSVDEPSKIGLEVYLLGDSKSYSRDESSQTLNTGNATMTKALPKMLRGGPVSYGKCNSMVEHLIGMPRP